MVYEGIPTTATISPSNVHSKHNNGGPWGVLGEAALILELNGRISVTSLNRI